MSGSALRFLSAELRQCRQEPGTRWRRLSAGRQVPLTLVHLRDGHPCARLAAGFGIGTTTAYRYITEAVEVLAALGPTLAEAVRTASSKAYLLLDGTLLPIDRIAADRPSYSGEHKRRGHLPVGEPELWVAESLALFAARLELSFHAVRTQRGVAARWPAGHRQAGVSYEVHRILASHPDRFEPVRTPPLNERTGLRQWTGETAKG